MATVRQSMTWKLQLVRSGGMSTRARFGTIGNIAYSGPKLFLMLDALALKTIRSTVRIYTNMKRNRRNFGGFSRSATCCGRKASVCLCLSDPGRWGNRLGVGESFGNRLFAGPRSLFAIPPDDLGVYGPSTLNRGLGECRCAGDPHACGWHLECCMQAA
jgi:hypothetical protein